MARGRISKLTPEVQAKICKYLKDGCYRCEAARATGITATTFMNWCARGRKDRSGIYFDFLVAVKKAEAEADADDIGTIKKASKKNWQAAAWRMERKHPERWGKRERMEVTGKDQGPMKVEITADERTHVIVDLLSRFGITVTSADPGAAVHRALPNGNGAANGPLLDRPGIDPG